MREQSSILAEKIMSKAECERKTDMIQKESEEITGKINGYDLRKKEILENARNISSLDRCPLCQQQVLPNHKHDIKQKRDETLNHADAELRLLHPLKAKKSEELDELRMRLKDIVESERKHSLLEAELKNIELMDKEIAEEREIAQKLFQKETEFRKELLNFPDDELAGFEHRIRQVEAILKKIRDQNILAEKRNGILALAKEKRKTLDLGHERVANISEELRTISLDLARLEHEIEKRKNIESEYLIKKKELDELQSKEVDFGKKQSSFETEIKMIFQIKLGIESEIDRKEAERRRLFRMTEKQTFLETDFVNLMLSMEKHIMVGIHREFTELFRKWFSLLVEDELLDARLDEDFSPVIMQNGYENDISNLSGGEKTAIALAYRLALNKVINDLISTIKTKDLIILDEPTDGFSEEQLDKVRDVLDELKMRQIIMVSHESKIEGFCDHVVRIVKNGHESAVI